MKLTKDRRGRVLNPNEDQMADGRYRYRYTDRNGQRKVVYSWKLVKTDKLPPGKKEDLSLREKIKKINRDLDDGIDIDASKNSVYVTVMHYLDTKAKISDVTKTNYIYLVESDIKNNKFGRMPICDVRKSHVKEFYKYLYKDRGLSVGSIGLFQTILGPAFELAIDDDIIRKNPTKDCMKEYTSTKEDQKAGVKFALTTEQQNKLVAFVKNSVPYAKYLVMIAFMLSTGCRIGEVLGLTWNDINFKEKYVDINHQILYKRRAPGQPIKHFADSTKNGTTRKIPLNNEIYTLLKEYRETTYFINHSNCTVDGYTDFVFLNNQLKLYTPNTIVRAFHNIVDAYNRMVINNDKIEDKVAAMMPDFTPHILRHTFCTRCAERGIDVKVLQKYMGHKTLAITMEIYNHVNQEREEAEKTKLEGMLGLRKEVKEAVDLDEKSA